MTTGKKLVRLDDLDAAIRKTLFESMQSPDDVARVLGVSLTRLNILLYGKKGRLFTTFEVPKRGGGKRQISAPVPALKALQSQLRALLEAVYKPKAVVHGFVKDRSIVSNAAIHVGARDILNVDLEGFFPSIHFGRVRGILMAKPYSRNARVATVLAQVCLAGEKRLPQGSPVSPIVANMVASDLDAALFRLIRRRKINYSRYADDLTFSTTDARGLPTQLTETHAGATVLGDDVVKIIESKGFKVNFDKVSRKRVRERREVTGLVVNERVNVPRERVRQIRAMLHALRKFKEAGAEAEFIAKWDRNAKRVGSRRAGSFKRVLAGRLALLAMVRGKTDPIYRRLVEKARREDPVFFERLPVPDDGLWVTWTDLHHPSATVKNALQGTAFECEGLGLVSCAHTLIEPAFLVRDDETAPVSAIVVDAISTAADIARLSATRKARYTFERGNGRDLKPGDTVFVAGFPKWQKGVKPRWTQTTIAEVRKATQYYFKYSLVGGIVEGMSGGPVLSVDGQVVGVCLTDGTHTEPHSFISIDAFLHLPALPSPSSIASVAAPVSP